VCLNAYNSVHCLGYGEMDETNEASVKRKARLDRLFQLCLVLIFNRKIEVDQAHALKGDIVFSVHHEVS
jgi:hypothetical protein